MHTRWTLHSLTALPSRRIKHQHYLLVWSCTHCASELLDRPCRGATETVSNNSQKV